MAGAYSFGEPYLQSILDKVARETGFIQPRYQISPGSNPGDNFNCRVFRAVITELNGGKNVNSLSLIFKVPPASKKLCAENPFLKKMSRTEREVYETVLPTLNKLLNKFGVVETDFFPNTIRCLASDVEDPFCDILVLEDKFPDGYTSIGDHKNIDAEHCRHVLKNLALWHSSSLALKHHEPKKADLLHNRISNEEMFNNADQKILRKFRQAAFEGMALLDDRIKQDKVLTEKLSNLIRNLPQEFVRSNEIPTDLCCIIQGDCWFNNILFKYNEDESLQNICLIDHQMTRFASPAVELLYMMFTCTTKDVRDAAYDNLIRFYHSEMCSLLRKMECDPEKMFPWALFEEHLKRYAIMPVLMVVSSLPVVLTSSKGAFDLHSSKEEGDDNATATISTNILVSNQKEREDISKRISDVVVDAARLGYL